MGKYTVAVAEKPVSEKSAANVDQELADLTDASRSNGVGYSVPVDELISELSDDPEADYQSAVRVIRTAAESRGHGITARRAKVTVTDDDGNTEEVAAVWFAAREKRTRGTRIGS